MHIAGFRNKCGRQALYGVTHAGVVVGRQVGERPVEDLSAELRQIDSPESPAGDATVSRAAYIFLTNRATLTSAPTAPAILCSLPFA